MRIEIADEGSSRATVRGRLVEAPPGPIEVTLEVTKTSPFDVNVTRLVVIETTTAAFELPRPTWPTSYVGELMSVDWSLLAVHESGDTARQTLDVSAEEITVESPSNDEIGVPAGPADRRVPVLAGCAAAVGLVGVVVGIASDRTWMWVLAGFLVFFAGVPLVGVRRAARQRSVFGQVRCRVDPLPDRLECSILAGPPAELGDAHAAATLFVAEMVSRSNVEGGPTDHEHVVVEHTIDLAPAEHHQWRGSIPMTTVASAPLSRHRNDDAGTTAVSWVVRFTLSATGAPDVVRILPLLALPASLDQALRPTFVEIPKSAR